MNAIAHPVQRFEGAISVLRQHAARLAGFAALDGIGPRIAERLSAERDAIADAVALLEGRRFAQMMLPFAVRAEEEGTLARTTLRPHVQCAACDHPWASTFSPAGPSELVCPRCGAGLTCTAWTWTWTLEGEK